MANPDHVRLLREDKPDALNKWRDRNPGEIVDCSGAQLTRRNYNKWNLSAVNFSGADLSECSIQNATCGGVNFRDAKLPKADFYGAKLEGADFSGADLATTRFERADMTGANLSGSDARSANFVEAILANTALTGANLTEANLQKANLTGGVDFRDVQIDRITMSRADLTGSVFTGKNLPNAKMEGANLTEANLAGCTLERAHLAGSKLVRSILRNASLVQADLSSANLEAASLIGADLTRANLARADVSKADFTKVNFYESNLTQCNFDHAQGLQTARHLETTIIPAGAERELYFASVILPASEKYVSWENIRFLGRLPLFAASYAALIAIPFLYYLLDAYNRHVREARKWAEREAESSEPAGIAQFILEHVQTEPIPEHSFVLLLCTISLAIGASIFAACPSRIREFSRDQWTDELDRSLAHYWAMAWKWRWARFACIFFYVVGGSGALFVLGSKLMNTARFIAENW